MPDLGGRPSKYTKELADEICFRLANGESIRTICRDEHIPVVSTIFYWITHEDTAPGFSEQYTKAKEMMIECYASEIAEIADDSTNDFYEKALKNGEVVVVGDNEMVNRARLRVDTRKWICERLAPKQYGPKSDLNFSGHVTHENFVLDAIEKSKVVNENK